MNKQGALRDLEIKIQSVNVWKRIVDLAEEKQDENLVHFMRVLEDVIIELHKSFETLKGDICLGW